MNREEFIKKISILLSDDVTIIDAIIEYAEKNDLEIETVASIIKSDKVLIEQIKQEALKLKLLKKEEDTTDNLMRFI